MIHITQLIGTYLNRALGIAAPVQLTPFCCTCLPVSAFVWKFRWKVVLESYFCLVSVVVPLLLPRCLWMSFFFLIHLFWFYSTAALSLQQTIESATQLGMSSGSCSTSFTLWTKTLYSFNLTELFVLYPWKRVFAKWWMSMRDFKMIAKANALSPPEQTRLSIGCKNHDINERPNQQILWH